MTRPRRCQWPGCKATTYGGRAVYLQTQQREAPFECSDVLVIHLALCSVHSGALRDAEMDPTRRTEWWSRLSPARSGPP